MPNESRFNPNTTLKSLRNSIVKIYSKQTDQATAQEILGQRHDRIKKGTAPTGCFHEEFRGLLENKKTHDDALCLIHAILFVLESADFDFQEYLTEQNQDRDFASIVYWVSKALAYMDAYEGPCTRTLTVPDMAELKYFQPGKIFRFKNLFQSFTAKSTGPAHPNKKVAPPGNLVLHLYSQTGRNVERLIHKSGQFEGEMVLFRPRTEFLVCKTEVNGSQMHVFLREVETGVARNVILCTTERTADPSFN